ncbi:hypothetical protein IFM89_009030 [Coptis chinensis]|uniref:Uncharacterized protein n=1 Tax=Coptis chinensis TaxID=261450 RepID=A0A835HDI1_9MAGN|nr:hypothetical protein IFM89_009030 [Coptis chinensis]
MAQTEQIFSQGALIYQTNHNFDLIEQERKSSTEVDLMKSGEEAKGDADLNKVEIKGVGKEISLPDRLEAFIKLEVVEEKCHDSSDSSSAGINEEVLGINIEEVRSKDIEPSIADLNNPYNEPNGPSLSLEVSEINSRLKLAFSSVNDAPPSSTESEAHVAFKHPDAEVLEFIIPSPSPNLESRELVPDNLMETILVSSEGASIIDSVNVNEVLFNDKKNIYERISSENIQGDDSGSSKVEVLINEPNLTNAALMDVEASDRGHETVDNVIEQQVSEASKEEDKASKLPQEEVALMDVEASDCRRVHETSNNLIERQVSEASHEEHKASKQPHKEVELVDVEASDRLHKSTDIVIERQESEASQEEDKASKQPQEEVALIAVEASDRVHETRNNLFERQDSEANDEEHKASKQPHKEVELVDVEASDRLHEGTNNVVERQVSEASHEEYKATTQPHEEGA